METLLIINGEQYWQNYLPNVEVVYKKIQTTEWVWKKDELYAIDAEGSVKPDKIFWRVGAIKPNEKHRNALEMIRLSGVSCLNKVDVLLKGFDRLSMLNELKLSNLPLIPFEIVTHSHWLKSLEMEFPFVVKVGNYHGGYGKVLVENAQKWQDIQDLLFVTNEYITVEPYIEYQRDIRYLVVGDEVWAMARKGKFWKANVQTTDFEWIEPEETLVNGLQKLQNQLGADILAIDVLEDKAGNNFVVEYNDIPGFSGFPESVKYKVAEMILKG